MRKLNTVAAAAMMAAAALAASAGSADAQTYGRLVVFGDSLSDNGNLFNATGGLQPPSPPFFQGRFSSGPVWAELLGFNLAQVGGPVTGSIGYAYGGARTDLSAFPPGMRAQLAAYLGAGGTFAQSDLVAVWGGANNIFQGLPVAGADPNPPAVINNVALSAATDISTLVTQVAGAGAGTVLVANLPRLSATPQFRNTPAAPLADLAVGTFNSALYQGLLGVAGASPNTNIILMDVNKAGEAVVANPLRFGFTNITDPCFNGMTVCSNPNSYFYFDGVHPTATGHQFLASLANDYLYYRDRGAASGVQGETGLRRRWDSLDAASGSLSAREWRTGNAVTAEARIETGSWDARGVVGETEIEGYDVRFGFEGGMGDQVRVGVTGSIAVADVVVGPTRFDAETVGIDLWAGWRSGNVFVTGAAGASHDSYDNIQRATGIGPIVHTADTSGTSYGWRVQAGMWFDAGGLAFSPRATLGWARTSVDGYIEQGAAAQHRVFDRDISAAFAEVTLRAEGDLFAGTRFFAEGGYRDVINYNADDVLVGIANNPARPLAIDIGDPWGGQGVLNLGVETDLGSGLLLSAGYRGRVGGGADSHQGGLALRLEF
ncbi:MAG: autotransporter domain-containing protein [Brevundimonas sp.]|uniref:autotransporter domain-containing protein n=1 Tax=Brevundimonas sp. TaxID=1871086 RepID=UPI00391D1EF2